MVVLLCENIVLLCNFLGSQRRVRKKFPTQTPPADVFHEVAQIIAVKGANLSIVETSGAVKGG